jgi:hypothetical protein
MKVDLEWMAEAFYEHLCRIPTTAEQRGQIIHELLSSDAPPHVKSVAIRLAMIHAAEEGHPGRRSLRPSPPPPPTNRRLN